MSDTTSPNGFPFPEDTDNVADYPALAEALAEAVNDHIGLSKSGTQSSGTLVAGTPKAVAYVFATAFPAAGPVPQVCVTISNGGNPQTYSAFVTAVSRSGFTVTYERTTGTAALSIGWIATNVGDW